MGGPSAAKGDYYLQHSRWSGGTKCSAVDGPGGPTVVAVDGLGGLIMGGNHLT